eukprot:CAMPEP_0119524184 /NCGR_PEP_ID=MMETSP1344-20130328/39170_1 /TAXON_ID=236787 /ORGANISM="Florenciella parvula, Strain CCMP2471" /LENGTH=106 /DNA_ID=CAMNT_0007562637 /DNA_START=81 /DNA_END=399 /DNA_ORIENTATION=+
MCGVSVHGGWKASDQGQAPGCAMVWVPPSTTAVGADGHVDEYAEFERSRRERKFYCHDHAPAGSHPYEDYNHELMNAQMGRAITHTSTLPWVDELLQNTALLTSQG